MMVVMQLPVSLRFAANKNKTDCVVNPIETSIAIYFDVNVGNRPLFTNRVPI